MTTLAPDRVPLAAPRLAVPAYFRPDARPDDWELLAQRRVRLVILNVASGPGTRPDQAYLPALARLVHAGVAVAGYVDTNYAQRVPRAAMADLNRFLRWYAVTGVCFDRAAVEPEHLGYYAALARDARLAGAGLVMFNHGAYPAEAYAEHADLLGTFEGPWRAYLRLAVPRWTRSRAASIFYHVVYSVPLDHFDDAYLLAMRRRAGCAYVTDRAGTNPYDRLPAGGFPLESPWRGWSCQVR